MLMVMGAIACIGTPTELGLHGMGVPRFRGKVFPEASEY
jgi:hypothetical protein